jgi:hypothetical protein
MSSTPLAAIRFADILWSCHNVENGKGKMLEVTRHWKNFLRIGDMTICDEEQVFSSIMQSDESLDSIFDQEVFGDVSLTLEASDWRLEIDMLWVI